MQPDRKADGSWPNNGDGELKLYAERKRSLQNRQEELAANLAVLREKNQALEEKQEQLRQSSAGIDLEKNRIAREVKDLEQTLAEKEAKIKELRTTLNVKKTLYTDKLAADSLLKQKISEAGAQKEFRNEKMLEPRTELDLIAKEMAETKERLNGIQAQLDGLRQEAEQVKTEERQLAAALQKHQTFLAGQAQKNQEIRERLRGVESKITILTEMERSHQGYYQGVKALLRATREPFYNEIHGIIADLIRPAPGYELALEVALGSALQNLVITHHRYAGQAINYLKQNRLGRATFLPLNLIEGKPDRFREYESILAQYNSKPATDTVSYDRQYQAVVSHLLSSTLVAPDLKTAVELAEVTRKQFRVVTLEGEIIAPGGAITGGNLERRQSGLLSRKGEIRRLKGEKQNLLAFLERGLNEENKLQTELKELSRQYEEKRNRGQEISFQQNSALKDMEVLSVSYEKTVKQSYLETALQKLGNELTAQEFTVNQLQGKLICSETETELIAVEIRTLEEQEGVLIQEREQCLMDLSTFSSRLAGVQQEWVGKQENLQDLSRNLEELRAEVTRQEKELIRATEELQCLEDERASSKAIEKSAQDLADDEAELEERRAEWQAALDNVNQMEISLRQQQNRRRAANRTSSFRTTINA